MIPKRPVNIYLYTIRGVVSWKYKKHTILAHSTIESEKIALAATSEDESW